MAAPAAAVTVITRWKEGMRDYTLTLLLIRYSCLYKGEEKIMITIEQSTNIHYTDGGEGGQVMYGG